ncbi:hypothetical protein C8F04DRAFT_1286865 [Mycena alexandri]|uniref:Uncharacterized protein n=1 Tax=Mycena alexandri TaxID=1745969 RepID=A0AAD6XH60_9AGAR|nr:hypothetical protein C8F04DRAFT_1286865 [Mycena alexandri]
MTLSSFSVLRSYWCLRDRLGNLFGDNIWICINVAETHLNKSSLSSSSTIVMPRGAQSVPVSSASDALGVQLDHNNSGGSGELICSCSQLHFHLSSLIQCLAQRVSCRRRERARRAEVWARGGLCYVSSDEETQTDVGGCITEAWAEQDGTTVCTGDSDQHWGIAALQCIIICVAL